jgi:prepilin peptidase CpaA
LDTPPPTPIAAATIAFLLACVVIDVRTLRIPNRITFPTMAAGLVLNSWMTGWWGAATSVAGCSLAIAILIVPFALGGIGAGDVKMMGTVGSLLGPQLVALALLVGMMAGGVFAILALAGRGRLREKLGDVAAMTTAAVVQRSVSPLRLSASAPGAVIFPYSLPLAFGTLAVITVSRLST